MHTKNLKHILLSILFISIVNQLSFSQNDTTSVDKKNNSLQFSKKELGADKKRILDFKRNDTIKKDSLQLETIVVNASDSTKVDSIPKPKELLADIIKKKSDDYISNDFITKKATLYNNAEVYYQDIELKAGIIILDYSKNLAYAKGIIDSAGVYTQRPIFKQGEQESVQDSLIYNFKNEKAVIYNTTTEQSGVLIRGEITKRENDSTLYINKARFTTSQKEKPDYYIGTNNIKVVPGKKIVGGLSQLYLADVPTPAILPFFYAPLSKERSESGIVLPTWGENGQQGFFLQNGGYYFAISDYVDLAVLGDVYTNGSWGMRFESSYALRYKFSGNFSLRFENLISGQRGFDNFSKRNNFFLRWSHSQDSKSNPNSRFSSSVNLGSVRYFRQSLNEVNLAQNITNTFSSSISYYKSFVGTPFKLNASLTHTQNTNTEQIDMNLPSMQVSMDRIYPFAPKNGTKKNALHNIGLNYNLDLRNNISVKEEEFFKSGMFNKAKNGMKQSVSMSTNMKAFRYITISPSANYNEIWYLKTIKKEFDVTLDEGNQVVNDTINGFDAYRDYSASVSASTVLYGDFTFKGRLKAIRHTLTPSVSFNYRPDFSNYYDEVQKNTNGDTEIYSRFEKGVFGAPSRGLSSSIGISINNVLEAKVMPKDSTEAEARKITLLNNLRLSTNYNVAADSIKWRPIRMSGGTRIFKEKLNLNFGATLDPYALNANGSKINTFNISNGGSLFRLTSANISASYSISSDDIGKNKGKKTSGKNKAKDGDSEALLGGDLNTRKSSFDRKGSGKKEEAKTAKLYGATIPWNLSLRYGINYSNTRRESTISNNSLQFSGSVELSPKWNVGISSGYDFKNKGITPTSLNFERDLDSWRMSFNWVPFGRSTTYYFFIGVKASILSDLKYDQRRVPDRRLF